MKLIKEIMKYRRKINTWYIAEIGTSSAKIMSKKMLREEKRRRKMK